MNKPARVRKLELEADLLAVQGCTYDIIAKIALLRSTVDGLRSYLGRYSHIRRAPSNSAHKVLRKLLETHYTGGGQAIRAELVKAEWPPKKRIAMAKGICTVIDDMLRTLEPQDATVTHEA